jgi:hypothetical protein
MHKALATHKTVAFKGTPIIDVAFAKLSKMKPDNYFLNMPNLNVSQIDEKLEFEGLALGLC